MASPFRSPKGLMMCLALLASLIATGIFVGWRNPETAVFVNGLNNNNKDGITLESIQKQAAVRSEHGNNSPPELPTTRVNNSVFHEATIQQNLCLDPDEPSPDPMEQQKPCPCTNRTVGVPNTNRPEEWFQHHQRMVADAENTGHNRYDVVLVGDSITEQWNGTRHWGLRKMPGMRDVFQQYFSKVHGAQLEGLALGSASDTTMKLLWHLQHGILNNKSTFYPKVWWILIGTNDFATRCSKQAILQGIITVVDYVEEQRPDTPILIHGILPCGFGKGGQVGDRWEKMQWINQQLASEVQRHDNWYYMETPDIFLRRNGTAMNPQRVLDGIHPSIAGMQAWAPRIVQAVQDILQERGTT